MVSLVDLVPQPVAVEVNGKTVTVKGLAVRDIGALLVRFPALMALFSSSASFSIENLVKSDDDAAGAIIAAGCGEAGNPDAEAAAGRLPVSVQAELLEAVLKASMTKGAGPFGETMTRIMGLVFGAEPTAAAVTEGVKVRAKSSPKASNSSAAAAIRSTPSLDTRPGNSSPG